MKYLETPEQRWGNRDYPYHKTGEVEESEYLNRLNPVDCSYLTHLLRNLELVARSMQTPLHALGVGSSADLEWSEYRDIDLLICPEKPAVREDFVIAAYKKIVLDPNFIVTQDSAKGSAPILNAHDEPYAPLKLIAFPVGPVEMSKYFKQFDITFVGNDAGSFKDVLTFHRFNNLAFCELPLE
ncbi:MAG TPA: hypothetical protein VMR81_01725 [Patescibacteria group bacterium]|nr:hypothetical protein [Patescibacteria group bacterium]